MAANLPETLRPDEDVDALLQALEEDDDVSTRLREERVRELQHRAAKLQALEASDHGQYTEVTLEKDFLRITTQEPFVVAHFYLDDFRRCQIVHAHLKTLAARHYTTRFVRIKVTTAPFFVDRLKVRTLPCIIAFVQGVTVDRLVGFDELGNTDTFPTEVLEARLRRAGVLGAPATTTGLRRPAASGIYSGARPALADEADDDG